MRFWNRRGDDGIMVKYVKSAKTPKVQSQLEQDVRALCESYNYKVTQFEEIRGIKFEDSFCVEMACNNGSISIKAVGNYNYTVSDMQICPLWGRIINSQRQIDGLLEAVELQAKIAEFIGARAL